MKSPNTSTHTVDNMRAFTLIEIIVVTAILSGMLALGASISIDAYHATLTRSERDTVAVLLARARSSAMANVYQTSWGVCYVAPNYIVFQGSTCTPGTASNELTPAARDVAVTGLSQSAPIVFAQLSGKASPATPTTPTVVTLVQQAHTSTITVNYEGAIQ